MNLNDPEAPRFRRPRFDPIRLGVLAAILVAFLALVGLILLPSSREKKRRPRRNRLVVSCRAAAEEIIRQVPVGEAVRDVA